MAIPDSVTPFVESDDSRMAEWLSRLFRVAPVRHAVALGLLCVLWVDVARQGVWPWLPGPFDVAGGYVLALLAGVALGAIVYRARPRAIAPAAAALPTPRLPVFLRFDGRPVVVVGGGAAAAAKIPALLTAGAKVTVIAPDLSSGIDRSRVHVVQRAFVPADLDGAWFVTAAATPAVNRAVREAAETRGIFVNAVDDPPNATAYLGGTIARGGVTVAISTGGEAPALAGLMREALDELLPADLDTWLSRARSLRDRQRAAGIPIAQRRPELLDALNQLYAHRPGAGVGEVRR